MERLSRARNDVFVEVLKGNPTRVAGGGISYHCTVDDTPRLIVLLRSTIERFFEIENDRDHFDSFA